MWIHPLLAVFEHFLWSLLEPLLQADRERTKRERIDLLIMWVGITALRGWWQVQKASAYFKKVDWIWKKRGQHITEQVLETSQKHNSVKGKAVIQSSWIYFRQSNRGRRSRYQNNVPLKLTILVCKQTFIYLYITITVRSRAAWQIPSSLPSELYCLNLQSTRPDEWSTPLCLQTVSFKNKYSQCVVKGQETWGTVSAAPRLHQHICHMLMHCYMWS